MAARCTILLSKCMGGHQKSPLTFHAEKVRGLCAKILIVQKFFELQEDFVNASAYT